ncbi:LytTR family two component transcriptional regulator [Arcticibacter tournemirensis]|uniref:Response regulator transcription factor n=1 Tax=Arcticibacter tournemirensis TaxID=699437 RepID=A0A4V1KIS0_9SPHI|nr:LytTR family DNA-binding domain-containing protein [Arcticibacter tournemirensis]KAA8481684.1 response regulator transcription factor [Arcticibacter tournemirensis]RXF71662.1 response regulator transcription factor [Arcticibacter tournemirensis]TQM48915.1 LytTR family two component transcriptional regulator [Arcticibacter tournemirensis]
MIRCLVVDDEPLALDILTDYIAKVPFLELVKATTSAFEALSIVQNDLIDLVFLDVQMPELTGIQFLKIINGKCNVILTTAYSQYALDGYELDVSDYLLKPIAFDRFYKAVLKVQNQQSQSTPAVTIERPVAASAPDFIFVKTEHRIQKIYINDILYIEGLKDYVSIFTAVERIITLQHMKKLEEVLPNQRFARVHKSFIVSIDKIESIERGRIQIGDKVIPIGDTYRDNFFKKIEDRNI